MNSLASMFGGIRMAHSTACAERLLEVLPVDVAAELRLGVGGRLVVDGYECVQVRLYLPSATEAHYVAKGRVAYAGHLREACRVLNLQMFVTHSGAARAVGWG